MAQDDYYYEIQLTNKQLVFYFMAGATGLILSFLAGVMVGKGVDPAAGEVQAARPAVEEQIVAEEPLARPTSPPPAEDLTYAQRLEGDKPEETLETKPRAAAASTPAPKGTLGAKAVKATPTPRPTPRATPTPAPVRTADAGPAAGVPAVAGKPAPGKSAPPASSGLASFTIQVGAFKDKATADSVVARLKAKGFAAYLVSPESAGSGLFNVRVGSYPARADAERVHARLRDQEKYKPFIVKN